MSQASELANLMNVGKATLDDLTILGITSVEQLAQQHADELYIRLNALTKQTHDPCVWDVFKSIIHEAQTGKKTRWWTWTAERKRRQTAGTFCV